MKKREFPRLGEMVWQEELESGLRVAVVPKPGYGKSMAMLAVDYGGADRSFELDGRRYDIPAGVAHFLEHKLFEQEDGVNALTALSERGANANAFTSPDMTAYHFECSDMFFEDLELLLKFVASPYFTDESVERERAIIAQEIRMMEDDPDDAMYYALLRCLYGNSPIRENVAGTVEDLEKITAQTLYTCHRAFYTPSNMTLVVVGNQDPGRVADMAGEVFRDSLAPRARRIPPKAEEPFPVESRTVREMDIGAPMFLAGARTAGGLRGRESVRHELVASIALSGLLGSASGLYRELYDRGLINETFGYDFENTAGCAHLSFGGETHAPDEVCLRVFEAAADIAARGFDADFFERRRKTTLGGAIRALNSFESICYNVAAGTFAGYEYFDTPGIIDAITQEEARSFLSTYLTPDRCAVSVVNNKKL